MRNLFLTLLGWGLCAPAILLGPFAKLTSVSVDRPWVDGLFINTWRAYKKYDTKSWIRRMISIYRNPELTLEYLNLLVTKKSVTFVGQETVCVQDLKPCHSVMTAHDHHRQRVADIRSGKIPHSAYGPMLCVDNEVHDGHHRLAAYIEAGNVQFVNVNKWKVG